LEAQFRLLPAACDEGVICDISFEPREPQYSHLLDLIPLRTTNRRRGTRSAIDPTLIAALSEAAASAGAKLQIVSDAGLLEEMGALMGAADRISHFNAAIHHEVMGGFRWTRDEVERHRDGLDVATLELTQSERAGMLLLSKWEVTAALKSFGGGIALEDAARKSIAASSAVGLLSTNGVSRSDYFRGGRALERTWLEATRHGLAFQPWTALPYLFARVERGGGAGLDAAEVTELRELRTRYRAVFDVNQGDAEVLLFRCGYADAPTARSLRRPLATVLRFA